MTGAIMKRITTLFISLILILSFSMFFPHDVYADELSGEIEVLINVNPSEMTKYKNAFEKKYPNVTVHYTTYYDYDSEVQKESNPGIMVMFYTFHLFFQSSLSGLSRTLRQC